MPHRCPAVFHARTLPHPLSGCPLTHTMSPPENQVVCSFRLSPSMSSLTTRAASCRMPPDVLTPLLPNLHISNGQVCNTRLRLTLYYRHTKALLWRHGVARLSAAFTCPLSPRPQPQPSPPPHSSITWQAPGCSGIRLHHLAGSGLLASKAAYITAYPTPPTYPLSPRPRPRF